MTDELKAKIEELIPRIEGWCSVEKSLAMVADALAIDAKVYVELGVFAGRSLFPMALALGGNGGMIYGIDPWKKEASLESSCGPVHDAWWEKLDYADIHEQCVKSLWRLNLESCIVLIRSQAHVCAPLFQTPIDLLHIDGNHSEETSVRDVQIWLPKVRSGGTIWFDDTDWLTTRKAVGLLTEACEVVGDVGTCRQFRKR